MVRTRPAVLSKLRSTGPTAHIVDRRRFSESDIGVRVDNRSEEAVTLDVFRLQEGNTFDDLVAHIGAGSAETPTWARLVGSMPTSAGETANFGMALSAGNYALVCSTDLPRPQIQAVAAFTVVV